MISPISLISHVVMNSFLGSATLQYLKHPSFAFAFGGVRFTYFIFS